MQVAVALVCKVARLVVKVPVVVVKVAVVPSNVVALASKAEMDVVQPEGQVSDNTVVDLAKPLICASNELIRISRLSKVRWCEDN